MRPLCELEGEIGFKRQDDKEGYSKNRHEKREKKLQQGTTGGTLGKLSKV